MICLSCKNFGYLFTVNSVGKHLAAARAIFEFARVPCKGRDCNGVRYVRRYAILKYGVASKYVFTFSKFMETYFVTKVVRV